MERITLKNENGKLPKGKYLKPNLCSFQGKKHVPRQLKCSHFHIAFVENATKIRSTVNVRTLSKQVYNTTCSEKFSIFFITNRWSVVLVL